MTLFFIVFFASYVGIAIFLILLTRKRWSKLKRQLLVAFLILLPSWDMVLGYIVYYAAIPFVPTMAIYQTAETDGIYYEGVPRNHLLSFKGNYGKQLDVMAITFARHDFERGYRYAESLITSVGDAGTYMPISPPKIYRCIPLPRDPQRPQHMYQQCIPVDDIQSGYVVKTRRFHFVRNTIGFVNIYDRSTGLLMGEYREVRRTTFNFIPFFIWLDWAYDEGDEVVYPERSRLYDFQFDVLKLKQNPSET